MGITVKHDNRPMRSPASITCLIICAAFSLSACGTSSLTSGLSGGMFGKESSQQVKNVTEEQLLSAAKNHNGQVTEVSGTVDIAHGCPRFEVWARDNTVTKYADGQFGDGLAVVHRGEITQTARECYVEPGRVTVKYGFSGRILMGPKGTNGRITLPVTIFITDAKRERITEEKFTIAGDVSLENPISYFSEVRTVTFEIPQGSRAGEFEVFVGFDNQLQQPNSDYQRDQGFPEG